MALACEGRRGEWSSSMLEAEGEDLLIDDSLNETSNVQKFPCWNLHVVLVLSALTRPWTR